MNDKKFERGESRNSGGDSLGLSDPLNLDSLEDDLNKLTGETIDINNESKPVNAVLEEKININIKKESSESQENANVSEEKPQKSKSGWVV